MTSTEIVDTPWGPSTSIERVAPGIAFVSTASHGGFMLSPDRQAAMPASLKPFTGDRRFWEEDCDAALVAARFADDMGIAPERAEKAAPVHRGPLRLDDTRRHQPSPHRRMTPAQPDAGSGGLDGRQPAPATEENHKMRNQITDFTVTGTFHFPWDMLRYDQAWPRDGEAASVLEAFARGEHFKRADPAVVRMRCHGDPTPDRWASFNWKCVIDA